MSTADRPPLGLRPRYVVVPERIQEISDAIQRYAFACLPIPSEWLEELGELSGWLDDHQRRDPIRRLEAIMIQPEDEVRGDY